MSLIFFLILKYRIFICLFIYLFYKLNGLLNKSFQVHMNELACQMCQLQVKRVELSVTRFLWYCFQVDPFMTQTR